MESKSRIRKTRFLLFSLVGIIVVCFCIQYYKVFHSDNKEKTITSHEVGDMLYVETPGADGSKDSWDTSIRLSDNPEDTEIFTGRTISLNVVNNNSYQINDWKLKINIKQECYLNGFWCGKYEIHQFRAGQERVEVVSSSDFDLNTLSLEHNEYTNELMIRLMPGDYMVYLPSEEVGENIVKEKTSVGAGLIVYAKDFVDLSDYELKYYTKHRFTEGIVFKLIIIFGSIWVALSVIIFAMIYTYTRTVRAVESVNNSIINGLSVEYRTLWLINVKDRTIKLMRNQDEILINNAVELASGFEDCDTAIKYYIDHYVDKADTTRVWRSVKFDNLINKVEEEKFYTVSYLHRDEDEGERYYQMVFVKVVCAGEENIVLGYRDVDKFERERLERNKQLEHALEAANDANRSKSIFLANMSHEIRTPINAILGMDTMILRESNEENVKGYARDIKSASNTLLALINDILDFSKIESGRTEIVPANYRLDSVLTDIINMIKPKADEKDLEFEVSTGRNMPAQLYGDEIRVKQVILNILNNAVKYTNKGKIKFSVGYVKKDESTCALKVAVSDTGVGIKSEDIENLFSPYYRLNDAKNRTIEGTGLGLTITKALLEKMGSELNVESVYGEGSTFSFVIEQKIWGNDVVDKYLAKVHTEEEKPESFHAREAAVLVVDDVEMNLIVIKNLLKRVCICPDTCLSGSDALELVSTKKYDLLLLDAMMPGMSGEDTLKAIRNSDGINAKIPAIVLTANAIVGAKEEYLKAGFDEYLSKPVDGDALEDMLQKYLPAEKIEIVATSEMVNKENNSSETDYEKELLKNLDNVFGINVSEGVNAAGGLDTYISVCKNFTQTATSRIEQIKEYCENRDFENYTIQVHALKSSARLVGAVNLSDSALALEIAGKEKDIDRIINNTESLIKEYDSIQKGLSEVFLKMESQKDLEEKEEISEKKLKRKLSELCELIQAFDFESAKDLFASLERYKMPESFNESYKALKVSMAEVDNDEIISIVTKYIK